MKKIGFAVLVCFLLSACYLDSPLSKTAPPSWIYQIAWPWDPSLVYCKGDTVTMPEWTTGGPIYESLQDGNVGIEPPGVNVLGDGWKAPLGSPGWRSWWVLLSQTQS